MGRLLRTNEKKKWGRARSGVTARVSWAEDDEGLAKRKEIILLVHDVFCTTSLKAGRPWEFPEKVEIHKGRGYCGGSLRVVLRQASLKEGKGWKEGALNSFPTREKTPMGNFRKMIVFLIASGDWSCQERVEFRKGGLVSKTT